MLTTQDERQLQFNEWSEGRHSEGIIRLHSGRQVLEQRGAIETDYPVARQAAEAFC
jgi:isocitrate lyase